MARIGSESQVNEPSLIRDMLTNTKTIAVIGLSADESKPSHYVSAYLKQQGYKVCPINPAITEVLGEPAYPSLNALPIKPDLVNVFRLPNAIPAIVDEMIALGLRNLWVQQGIVNLAAAARAEAAAIRVVMDRCIMAEHRLMQL
jgi:predicted CoA-binding protein